MNRECIICIRTCLANEDMHYNFLFNELVLITKFGRQQKQYLTYNYLPSQGNLSHNHSYMEMSCLITTMLPILLSMNQCRDRIFTDMCLYHDSKYHLFFPVCKLSCQCYWIVVFSIISLTISTCCGRPNGSLQGMLHGTFGHYFIQCGLYNKLKPIAKKGEK